MPIFFHLNQYPIFLLQTGEPFCCPNPCALATVQQAHSVKLCVKLSFADEGIFVCVDAEWKHAIPRRWSLAQPWQILCCLETADPSWHEGPCLTMRPYTWNGQIPSSSMYGHQKRSVYFEKMLRTNELSYWPNVGPILKSYINIFMLYQSWTVTFFS